MYNQIGSLCVTKQHLLGQADTTAREGTMR